MRLDFKQKVFLRNSGFGKRGHTSFQANLCLHNVSIHSFFCKIGLLMSVLERFKLKSWKDGLVR